MKESLPARQAKAAQKQSEYEKMRQSIMREVFEMMRANGGSAGIGASETVETLRDLDIKCEQAKVDAMESGDDEPPWVETEEKLYNLILRKRKDTAGYQDYHGVKICLVGRAEEIKAHLARPLDEINHPATAEHPAPGKVQQPNTVKTKVGSANLR